MPFPLNLDDIAKNVRYREPKGSVDNLHCSCKETRDETDFAPKIIDLVFSMDPKTWTKWWNKKTPIDEKTFFFKSTCGTNFHSTYILTMLYLTAQFTDFVVACFGWSSNRKYNNVQRMRSSSGSWGSVTIFCQWTVGKHSLERMLLVKVWVPKTHPSFEKRETVLPIFFRLKTDHHRISGYI